MKFSEAIDLFVGDMWSQGRFTSTSTERSYRSILDRHNEDVGNRDPRYIGRDDVGALDAIVAEYQKVAAPQPATERHLTDALATRDRLLAMVEVAFRPTASMPPPKLVSE